VSLIEYGWTGYEPLAKAVEVRDRSSVRRLRQKPESKARTAAACIT
jgi:hypothetical protein